MKIGIMGGGQLGMMLAEAAIRFGHQVYALDPNPDAPIKHTGAELFVFPYHHIAGVQQLVDRSDVICYEFENVSVDVLVNHQNKIPQGLEALRISQDRFQEKTLAQSLGIPTPHYILIEDKQDFDQAFYPSILKTLRMGYDGKGQFLLNSKHDVNLNYDTYPMILEEKIDFSCEVSVILTRDKAGIIVYYPLIQNVHEKGILTTSIPWWDAPSPLVEEAYLYAKRIVDRLSYVGTFAIEFLVKNDHVIFNEMAPRPHNSGHFSIEGTTVSQFENMIYALTNQPLIKPNITQPSAMINVLGQHKAYIHRAQMLPQTFIHDYHKTEYRTNRKMGHITILDEDFPKLKAIIQFIKGEQDANQNLHRKTK
jgi:5-(carboxyamino)imidazole ribonucleotide synthase